MALWSKVLSFFAGEAAGAAASDIAKPAFEPTRQNAWARRPYGILDPGTAAKVRTQGIPSDVDLADDAIRNGIGGARFDLLVEAARRYPGTAEALLLWRRKIIDQPDFTKALRRAGVPDTWVGHLSNLKLDLLEPGELAAAIHRGLVADPGLLQGEQPKPPFNVEAYPVYPIDALDEAAGSGYNKDRLGVLVGLQGLPMGVIEAAHAFYRKIITHGDYIRAFNTSNSRNEWAAAVLEYARQIPTARDFFENALRGYHSLDWAQEQAERHGMSHADSLVIYQNQGRPMNVRQITQALSRGGTFKPEPGEIKDPYLASIVEGNLKPAYYDLADSLKYTLPSPFVMRQLTSSGVWSEAKAAKRLKDSGWIPQDADEAAKAWAGDGGTTADPHIKKAQTQLYNTTRTAYLAGDASDAVAMAKLPRAGVSAAAVDDVLALWKDERDIQRQRITPAQVKKAWTTAAPNEVTGLPWSYDDALAELLSRGWSHLDATTFLKTPKG